MAASVSRVSSHAQKPRVRASQNSGADLQRFFQYGSQDRAHGNDDIRKIVSGRSRINGYLL